MLKAALPALLAALLFPACTRQPPGQPQRIAVVRFENLSSNVSGDWMGRAFSEVIAGELAGAPGLYAIPSSRMHNLDRILGARPVAAPGISSERSLAVVSGASRIGYGDFSVSNGRLQARLTIEDPQAGKITAVLYSSAPAGDVIQAATGLARQISPRLTPYGTRNQQALRSYVMALEGQSPTSVADDLTLAVTADPDFLPPYLLLAQWKAQRQDRSGALATIQQALSRPAPASESADRVRLELESANLRNDSAARLGALRTLVRIDPEDPASWQSLAASSMDRRLYREAAASYRKALDLVPSDVNLWNQLGYASVYAGDLQGAVSALRRYQQLRPADANPLDSLGDVNLIAGGLREAEEFYLQADRKDPNFLNGADLWKAAVARLMTGDVAGADALAKQYAEARNAARDPLVEYRGAEWLWISGRRKPAWQRLMIFARNAESGSQRELASRAYAELAIWSLVMGEREAAGQLAQRSAAFVGPSSVGLAIVARFLTQPPAPAAEWAGRAEKLFPANAPNALKELALTYALLLDSEFQPASGVLKPAYENSGLAPDQELPVLLAWTYLETGRPADAAPLLRFNPVPSPAGPGPFFSFEFPRLYYLRGMAAAREGRPEEARTNFKLFTELSGPQPFIWGEEKKAAALR
jgi:tetratricopeptide (TPR) repeat protein